MRLRETIKKLFSKPKTHQYNNEYAYKLVEYVAGDNKKREILWNGTNLTPPKYIVDKSKNYKLYLNKVYNDTQIKYIPKKGERYFTYKSSEKYIQERLPVLKLYWENNYLDCQNRYSSYEEYIAISCKPIGKQRIELVTTC